MWGATTLKLKKKSIKFLKNRCQSPGGKYNGGGVPPPAEAVEIQQHYEYYEYY